MTVRGRTPKRAESSSMQKRPVVLCAFSVLLASCSRSQSLAPLPSPPDGAAAVRQRPATVSVATIFSFDGADGKEPYASLIALKGKLFGTTYGGGKHDGGTVFELSVSGKERVLHAFAGGTDGSLPEANLLDVQGTLYGTTVNGGGSGDEGTVFAIASSGAETILHRFGGGEDGANPYAGLTDLGGALYGTTSGGGADSAGTVYKVTTSGSESVLYSFGSKNDDGATPIANLTEVAGVLYGTTSFGGKSGTGNCYGYGCGTVFKITTSGTEEVLYSFEGGTDSSMPSSPLIKVGTMLYGTTMEGGTENDGTVFEITTSGTERLLYSFKGGSDGAVPIGLTALKGTLYGTTASGGSSNDGTIFEITASGSESVLYAFKGGTDGAMPEARLHDFKNALYGTTSLAGGSSNAGTVFKVTP
jgi:uncharacterized repeat protein (TIGR03803 family)